MKSPYTPRQGQFLVFIHQYTTLHGRPPAEAELVQHFQVTPPTVHQMILTLDRRRLITRTPGQARSIRLNLAVEQLPPPYGPAAANQPSPERQTDGPDAAAQGAHVQLGKILIADLFAHAARALLDDAEFLPLLDTIIGSFARAGLRAPQVKTLRRHACELYHRGCQEAAPDTPFATNMELMFSALPGPVRTLWQRAL